MTHQEYLQQNSLGFEGDTFLKSEIERLIEKYSVTAIIETGTYMGATTLQFSKMVNQVATVESNPEYYATLKDKLGWKNIIFNLDNSVNWLPGAISHFQDHKVILIFLDAHWGDNNPLLQELKVISESGIKPIIVIHDFKVPDHPELGFDSYGGQDYEWDWIKDSIESIYGQEYEYHYNSEATGAKRGVIFIEPITENGNNAQSNT